MSKILQSTVEILDEIQIMLHHQEHYELELLFPMRIRIFFFVLNNSVNRRHTLVDAVAILVPVASKDIAASGPSCARIGRPSF